MQARGAEVPLPLVGVDRIVPSLLEIQVHNGSIAETNKISQRKGHQEKRYHRLISFFWLCVVFRQSLKSRASLYVLLTWPWSWPVMKIMSEADGAIWWRWVGVLAQVGH